MYLSMHDKLYLHNQLLSVLECSGFLTYVVNETFRRTPRNPELPLFCLLADGEGEPAVSTVDAAGRRRVFKWVNE